MKYRIVCFSLLILFCFLLWGCKESGSVDVEEDKTGTEEPIQIGVSFDTFVLERWLRDRDVISSTAEELGAEVNIQNAGGDLQEQVRQIEYLIEKKVDVLIIIAVQTNARELVQVVEKAQEKGIQVIAYDRLIENANVDLYISFDGKQIGQLMAQAALDSIPENGKIAVIYGPKTDHNISLIEEGIRQVLEEHDQTLVYQVWAPQWEAEYGYTYTNQCLEQVGQVDALICGNDALAAMAFQALSERQLAGEISLIGQDADLDACQRIVEGNQYMTVYKSIPTLAKLAAQYSVKMAEGEEIQTEETISDGTYQVPYVRVDTVAVTKENMEEVIIDSQFHFKEDVYMYAEEE